MDGGDYTVAAGVELAVCHGAGADRGERMFAGAGLARSVGTWRLALVPDPLNPGKFYPPTAQHATRQAAVLARNLVAALEGRPPEPFKFKMIGALAAIGRRAGVAEIYGLKFSGLLAWWLWRGIYLSKLPGFQKKVRVMLDWTLDLLFSKEIVQLPNLRSATMSSTETPAATTQAQPIADDKMQKAEPEN